MKLDLLLSTEQKRVLAALLHGSCLKVHRTPDGDKVYRLATPDNTSREDVAPADATVLERQGLIASNMKFPAATFLLTDKGVDLAGTWSDVPASPLGPRNYGG